MPIENSGLQARPFIESGHPRTFVKYRAQQDAFKFLEDSFTDDRGVALLYGQEGSGKTAIARHFASTVEDNVAVAYVNGEGLYASQLLSRILEQFGYDVSLSSTDELLNMMQVFLVQQTRTRQPPLLIVDNLNRMFPGALSALCKLAMFVARDRFAMRFVFASRTDCHRVIQSPSMAPIAKRLSGSFEVRPMSAQETNLYLYTKLRADGTKQPDDLLPVDTCDKLFAESGGYPGPLDKAAAWFLEHGETRDEVPRLIITRDGETLQDIELVGTRVLIGRSELSDIFLTDQFISKQHALIIWNDDSIVLIDLNSSNGTFVNSRRIKTQVLRNNDVVSLGDHRIKLMFERAGTRTDFEDADLADTATMKNIADARKAKAIRNVALRAVR